MPGNVVIIGAGQAGLTAAVSLKEQGWSGEVHLIGEEYRPPYQRPPLSKGYLSGADGEEELLLRSQETLERDGVRLHLGRSAKLVDRSARRVYFDDRWSIGYEVVIFATGSKPRTLTCPGSELDGIHALRTAEDADALKADLANGGDTVLIGGGFMNLEVAAEALKHGRVTLLEAAPQVLGRVLSRETANALYDYHVEQGVEVRCSANIAAIQGDLGRVSGVELEGGEVIPAARVVIAIGAVARDELAAEAGLTTAGGIVVDESLRTGDERVFAIGDCAKYPNRYAGVDMRVESVQNATDHGRHVAAILTDRIKEGYRAVPWFWSTQGERRLQIAGIAMPADEAKVVEQHTSGKLVVERLRGGEVVAVETINAPAAHMRARKTLAGYSGSSF